MDVPRQLDLLKGPRQRGKRAPAPSEFAVHCLIADTIKQTGLMPGWFFFHPANGEQRETPTAIKLLRMGVKPGVPDFVFIGPPWGRVRGYELKRRGMRPTEAQKRVGEQIIEAGGLWEWGDSYEKAIETFVRWGALPDRIEVVDGQIVVRRARA